MENIDFVTKKKKRLFDRRDGVRIKKTPIINRLMSGLYPNRCDCEISSIRYFDITKLMEYIDRYNLTHPDEPLKFFQCFVTILARVINERRYLLRFIANKKIYEHDEIKISFIAKKKFEDCGEEQVITYLAKPEHNVLDVGRYINKEVNALRSESVDKNRPPKPSDIQNIPDFFVHIFTAFLRFMNKHFARFMPKMAMREDPSFSTALVSNLGSIGLDAIYHHLNNYGSCSMMFTLGVIKFEEHNIDGLRKYKTLIDISSIFDERIADGYYFARTFDLINQYLKHPECLFIPFNKKAL